MSAWHANGMSSHSAVLAILYDQDDPFPKHAKPQPLVRILAPSLPPDGRNRTESGPWEMEAKQGRCDEPAGKAHTRNRSPS